MKRSLKEIVKTLLYALVVDILLYILKSCIGEDMFDYWLQKIFIQVWYLWIGLFVVLFSLWRLQLNNGERKIPNSKECTG